MSERPINQDFLGFSEAVWAAPVDLAAAGVPAGTREVLAGTNWADALSLNKTEKDGVISRLSYWQDLGLTPAQNRERVFGLAAMLFPEALEDDEHYHDRDQMACLLLNLAAACRETDGGCTTRDPEGLCAEIVARQAFDTEGWPRDGTLLAELAREIRFLNEKRRAAADRLAATPPEAFSFDALAARLRRETSVTVSLTGQDLQAVFAGLLTGGNQQVSGKGFEVRIGQLAGTSEAGGLITFSGHVRGKKGIIPFEGDLQIRYELANGPQGQLRAVGRPYVNSDNSLIKAFANRELNKPPNQLLLGLLGGEEGQLAQRGITLAGLQASLKGDRLELTLTRG